QASANVPSVEALSTTTARNAMPVWASTESRQRSSVASAFRTGMQTATRASGSSPKTVTVSPPTASWRSSPATRGWDGWVTAAFIGRGARSLSRSAREAPDVAALGVADPDAAAGEGDRGRAEADLALLAPGVRPRVDDRDGVVVDAGHPQLAPDPRRRERVRADADPRRHRAARRVDADDPSRLARHPEGARRGGDPVGPGDPPARGDAA